MVKTSSEGEYDEEITDYAEVVVLDCRDEDAEGVM